MVVPIIKFLFGIFVTIIKIVAKTPTSPQFLMYLLLYGFVYNLTMSYKRIYLKIPVLLVCFLNEVLIKQSIRFFARIVKSVLVDSFIRIVKKLFVSKTVIFSSLRRY